MTKSISAFAGAWKGNKKEMNRMLRRINKEREGFKLRKAKL